MDLSFIDNMFKNLKTPVIACIDDENLTIACINFSANRLLNPLLNTKALKAKDKSVKLKDILRFHDENTINHITHSLRTLGSLDNYKINIISPEGKEISAAISANMVIFDNTRIFVFYIYPIKDHDAISFEDINNAVYISFNMVCSTENADEAIDKILTFIGNYVNVSRAYIFEEISSVYTRNTYEWCNEGVEPAIQDLQYLRKEDYNYEVIVNSGTYITDDIRDLPPNDREILEAQGIKSLAILPLFYGDKAIGYVGFDDCDNYRNWSQNEIRLLEDISIILVSLIARRNSETKAKLSLEVLQTISNNLDNIIYVNDIETMELLFVNKALQDSIDKSSDELLGEPCWKYIQKDQAGPCEFCPIPKMVDKDNKIKLYEHRWESENTITKKWYMIKDAIIQWIDGRYVHIETATEITNQKQHETQLTHYASTDMMTGTYNREWGYKAMQEMLDKADTTGEEISLIFLDLDGLKYVNDTFGHSAGDLMITEIIDVTRESIRKSDIICRWGGDEFIIIMQCEVEVAQKSMNTITNKLKKINKTHKLEFKLALSYGITSLKSDDCNNLDSIISYADSLMYKNKLKKRSSEYEDYT